MIAARVTGIGIGLLVFMVTWLIGARLAEMIWETPVGPVIAMVTALAVGSLTAVMSGRRLASSLRS
jgi:hypothetical protein